jgi:hypothetical protein
MVLATRWGAAEKAGLTQIRVGLCFGEVMRPEVMGIGWSPAVQNC